MSLSEERLDEIRERANLQCGLDGDDADDLLIHVDHLTAERDEWKARHAAFRRTVETMRSELIDRYGVIDDILDRDDERGAK